MVRQAQKAVAHATSVEELRAAQAVLMPAVMGATLMTTAVVLGVGRATVARLQARFRQSARRMAASVPRRNWGGRRSRNGWASR